MNPVVLEEGTVYRRISWWKRLMPILVIEAYLTFTVLLFVYSPWYFPIRDPQSLYGFLISAQIALFGGFLAVAHKAPKPAVAAKPPNHYIVIGLIASFAIFPILSYGRTGRWIPDFVGGFTDPSRAYRDAQALVEAGGNAGTYLKMIVNPLIVMTFPLAVYYWARIGQTVKAAVVALAVGTALMTVAMAQRREIADLLGTLPLILTASHWAGGTRLSKAKIWTLAAGATLFAACFGAYFIYSQLKRIGFESAVAAYSPVLKTPPNLETPILKPFPPEVRPALAPLIDYFSSSYYGLSLSMDREFKPTYGAGSSIFLTRNVAKLTKNPEFERRPYPVQISERDGYRFPVFWPTGYAYFASDFTFPGTVALMFFLGALFGLCWIDSLGGRNPYAVVMLFLMALMMAYLPANTRLLQDGEGVFAFFVWLAVYLWDRTRRSRPEALPA